MRTNALLALVALLAASSPAQAEPEVLVVTVANGAVDPGEVRDLLRVELPGMQVAADDGYETAGVTRVTIGTWADGRLAVSYRDASGRETVRLVDPGTRPAATIAMIVVNLHEDQLDTILPMAEAPRRLPPVVRAVGPARVRATVQPTPEGPEAATLGAGLGFMQRSLAVDVAGSETQRTFTGSYPTMGVEGTVFPARLLGDRGFASWLGVELSFERAFLLSARGIDASRGESMVIDAAYQAVAATLLLDVPLGSRPAPPRLRFALGWNEVQFQFDPTDMTRLDPSMQVPSFQYPGLAAVVGVDGALGDSGLTAHANVALHVVTDVGQEVRDLLGADTGGATGFSARAGLGGGIVRRLDWSADFDLQEYFTTPEGASSAEGGAVGGFPSVEDRYLALRLGLAYRTD